MNVIKLKELKPLYKEISLYDGRHTFITLMYYKGMSKELLKEITGHTTDEMIDRYYLKYDSDKEKAKKRAAIAKFYQSKDGDNTQDNTKTTPDDDNKIIADQARENFKLKQEVEKGKKLAEAQQEATEFLTEGVKFMLENDNIEGAKQLTKILHDKPTIILEE